jgi:DNA-binding NtrC family response regulator
MENDWPGNVRELKNAVESAAVLATGDTIGLPDFEAMRWSARIAAAPRQQRPEPDSEGAEPGHLEIPPTMTIADVERLLIRDRLARFATKADAARSLGIGTRTLYTKLKGLKADERQKGRGMGRG